MQPFGQLVKFDRFRGSSVGFGSLSVYIDPLSKFTNNTLTCALNSGLEVKLYICLCHTVSQLLFRAFNGYDIYK